MEKGSERRNKETEHMEGLKYMVNLLIMKKRKVTEYEDKKKVD